MISGFIQGDEQKRRFSTSLIEFTRGGL